MGRAIGKAKQVTSARLVGSTDDGRRSDAMRSFERPFVVALFAFVVALLCLSRGIGAPFVKDAEPQSAQWIQSVVNGHALIPHDYYDKTDRKPPLFYWLGAAVTLASGDHDRVTVVQSRVVSLVAASIIALEVLLWTAAEAGPSAGMLAFLFLLGSYAFAARATLALTDMLLLLWMLTAWCLLYPVLEYEDARPGPWRIVAIGLVLGLGILTKGPIAVVLTGLAAALWLLFKGRWKPLAALRRGWPWAILGISLAVASCWYVPAFIRGGDHLFDIFMAENYGHFLPHALGGTGEAARPVYYIALRIFGRMMPLTYLTPALLLAIWARGFTEKASKPVLFQLTFTLTVLVFFSIASAKRSDYILPAMPGLAIGFAALFTDLKPATRGALRWAGWLRDVTVAGTVLVMALGLLAIWLFEAFGGHFEIAALGLLSPASLQARLFVSHARNFSPAFAGVLFAALLAVCALWVGRRLRLPTIRGAGLGVLSLAGVLLFTASIRPEADNQRTLKHAARAVMRIVDDKPLYIVRGRHYELSYWCGRKIPPLVTWHDRNPVIKHPVYVFALGRDLRHLDKNLRDRLNYIASWPVQGYRTRPSLYLLEPAGQHFMPQPGQNKKSNRWLFP